GRRPNFHGCAGGAGHRYRETSSFLSVVRKYCLEKPGAALVRQNPDHALHLCISSILPLNPCRRYRRSTIQYLALVPGGNRQMSKGTCLTLSARLFDCAAGSHSESSRA